MKNIRLLIPLTLLMFAPAFCAQALDWPQWRGPRRGGLSKETGLLAQWPKEGPKLLWRIKDAGLEQGNANNARPDFQQLVIDAELALRRAVGAGDRDRFALLVEKAVELGAAAIYPVLTERCIVRLTPDQYAEKSARWKNLAKFGTILPKFGVIGFVLKIKPPFCTIFAATPATREISGLFRSTGGRRRTETSSAFPVGASHVRPRRPRPAV